MKQKTMTKIFAIIASILGSVVLFAGCFSSPSTEKPDKPDIPQEKPVDPGTSDDPTQKPQSYTITYENLFDATHTNPISYTSDTEITLVDPDERAGCLFDGWYLGETEITQIAKGTTGDLTIEAKWIEFESTGVTLYVKDAQAKPGDTIEMTVFVGANSGFAYIKYSVSYNSEALVLSNVADVYSAGLSYTASQSYDVNPYMITYTGTDATTKTGACVKLTFTVKDTAVAGEYAVTLTPSECYDGNYDDVTVYTINSSVVVG